MDEHKLIGDCESLLDNANGCLAANDPDGYCARMSELLNLLLKELVGAAPGNPNMPLPEESKS